MALHALQGMILAGLLPPFSARCAPPSGDSTKSWRACSGLPREEEDPLLLLALARIMRMRQLLGQREKAQVRDVGRVDRAEEGPSRSQGPRSLMLRLQE